MAKRTVSGTTPVNLLQQTFDWYQHYFQWCEMVAASSMTIAMRLSGIGYKWQTGRPQDMTEMWRMVAEKNQAVLKSADAAAHWQSAAQQWTKAMAPWQGGGTGSGAATDFMTGQLQFGQAMLKAFSSSMQPFHKASTSNAFRLSGTRKPKR